MINPLKVATDGYLKKGTKAVLIIAVAGYLNFGGAPTPPIPPPIYAESGDGVDDVNREVKRWIEADDEDMVLIIKFYMQHL